ncbi:hypothetical protein B0A52_02259 [Exophiala mesophila]|uniref:Survival Motor Neuron Gemin2-binding domain-containing protein n=1 Tax=Exophiala mesophila TaxID=212818 RepID=A0A438NBH9_EXOME|nr:hypothetical protein B0A52_02259 [Exophiala mesophila]
MASNSTVESGVHAQAEIWDDSALLRSWDDAVKEYEYYHSIHARGEDVEKILREAEAGETDVDTTSQDVSMDPGGWEEVKGDAALLRRDANLDDGTHLAQQETVGVNHETSAHSQDDNGASATRTKTDEAVPSTSNVPSTGSNSLIGPQIPLPSNNTAADSSTSQDQTLENIKMAYYWAGYYSGLHDGQRQSQP